MIPIVYMLLCNHFPFNIILAVDRYFFFDLLILETP